MKDMTQEERDLLLKDLSSRLPYGVNVEYTFEVTVIATNEKETMTEPLFLYSINTLDNMTVSGIDNDGDETICFLDEVKPYLFPLSSITEEQKQYLKNRFCYDWDGEPYELWKYQIEIGDTDELIDWFNKNHIDYRCLISKGLALDATGLNIY